MGERNARRPRAAGLGDAFSALRGNRAFQCLWLSNVFFFGGVWTQTLVLGWMAWEMTHSDFLVALFTTARLAPMLLGPLAGAFADRHDRVMLLMIACGWAAVAVSVVAALASFDALSYPVLVAGGLAIGLAQSPSQPARASLALVLVGPSKLSNANALNSLALNVTQVIGPAIGGAMIAAIGAPAALWISVAWYVLSLLLLVPLRRAHPRLHPGVRPPEEPMLRLVVHGIRSLRHNRIAISVLLVTLIANALLWPVYGSFMPIFADQRLGLDADGLGWLLACVGIGGLIGALAIASMGDFRRKGAVFIFGTIGWGVLWAVFSQVQNVPFAFALMVAIGITNSCFGVLQTTLLLLSTEPTVHGRVLGIQELAIGIMPLATLGIGAAAEQLGVATATLAAASLLVIAIGILAIRVPEMLRFGESKPIPPESLAGSAGIVEP